MKHILDLKHIYLIVLLLACTSCNSNKRKIKLKNDNWQKIKTIRLDQVLLKAKNIEEIHQQFIKYPQLYQNFYANMIRAGKKEDVLVSRLPNSVKSNLKDFVNKVMQKCYQQQIVNRYTY